jgi:hypothetical protein
MAPDRRRIGPGSIAAAAPDAFLATLFLATWLAPRRIGLFRIQELLLIVLLEFIVLHSAAFMGEVAWSSPSRTTRALRVIGLGVFYTAFVAAFAMAFGQWWPVPAFWALTANRLLGVVFARAPKGQERERVRRDWGIGVALYLIAVGATTLLPVPRLGLGAAVAEELALPGSGLWIEQPHRVVAAGFLYFLGRALTDLYGSGTRAIDGSSAAAASGSRSSPAGG